MYDPNSAAAGLPCIRPDMYVSHISSMVQTAPPHAGGYICINTPAITKGTSTLQGSSDTPAGCSLHTNELLNAKAAPTSTAPLCPTVTCSQLPIGPHLAHPPTHPHPTTHPSHQHDHGPLFAPYSNLNQPPGTTLGLSASTSKLGNVGGPMPIPATGFVQGGGFAPHCQLPPFDANGNGQGWDKK